MPSLASQRLPQEKYARVEDWILRDDEDAPRFYRKLLADQTSIRATQTAQPKALAQSNADATLPEVGGCSPSHLADAKPTALQDEKLDRYERRMRHKIKDDRYDYKETKVQKKLERLSKHLRRAIAHKFHAPNVAQDRLTINHRQDLGIFKKGKTSSPIKSRVPILGFSEEDFLAGKSQSLIPRNDVSETYFGPLPDRDTADTTRCEMQKSIRHEDHRSQHGTDGKNGNVLKNAMRSPRTALDLSSDPDLESHTRNLLRVNFRSPTKATPGKRLWTLEDLHRLLRERETLWDSGKNDTQASQRSRISLNRDFLKRMSSSSPMRTATTAPMPPKKIQRTGKGHAIQREHRDPGIKSRATILSANSKTPPEYAHRQEESLRKVTRDWITPTKSSQHILPCEVLQNERPNMPDVPYSEGKDEVCRQVSCDAQSNSTFVTSSGHNEIIDDCFPLSPSKVDYAALEAACDAILASESNFFEPLQESFREISASSFEPGIPTRRPESALERKPSARDTHEDTHGYANDDRTCYYLSSHSGDRSWKAPASGAVRDVPLSRYITTIYDGGLFTENEQMQTRAEFTTHAEGCLECRLRQGSGSHCEPTRLQIDVSDNLRGFWQRRMLY